MSNSDIENLKAEIRGEMTAELTQTVSRLQSDNREDLSRIVHSAVSRELHRLISDLTPREHSKPGPGGHGSAIKKSFTIPSDVWTDLERTFRSEAKSNVVTAALRLYLRLWKSGQIDP